MSYLDPVSMGCKCNPKLCNDVSQGSLSNGRGWLYLEENIWVDAYKDEGVSEIIIHDNCPFDYCNTNKSLGIDLDQANTQCALNRAGLCGSCKTGFSLAIGSNKYVVFTMSQQ